MSPEPEPELVAGAETHQTPSSFDVDIVDPVSRAASPK